MEDGGWKMEKNKDQQSLPPSSSLHPPSSLPPRSLSIAAILLAAGQSRRMGTQKLLLPYAGRTVIGHIAAQLLQSSIQHLLVVVGSDRAPIAQALSGSNVALVPNDDPQADMLSSVRCGLRACPPACDAVLVALGDQPSISPDLVDRMIAKFDPRNCSIVVPTHADRRGHPILFATTYRDEILTSLDGIGLRGLLAAHPAELFEIDVDESSVLSDMDYPQDYFAEIIRLGI
jgi:molybdenum cofactor cytidylyltransferase